MWTPLGVFASLISELPVSGGSILSGVPWNPSASSWLSLIPVNQLEFECLLYSWAAVGPGSEGKCQQCGTRIGVQVVNVSHCDRCLWSAAQAPEGYIIPFQIKHMWYARLKDHTSVLHVLVQILYFTLLPPLRQFFDSVFSYLPGKQSSFFYTAAIHKSSYGHTKW